MATTQLDSVEEAYPEEDELDGLVDSEAVYSVERMADLLIEGGDLDKEFILSEIQQLLGHCADDFQTILLPVLCENCVSWDAELQFKAAQALSYVVNCPIRPESGKAVMKSCTSMLEKGTKLEGEDRTFYYQVWSGILVESMQTKGLQLKTVELQSLLQLAASNAQSPTMEGRKAAARIYGALATLFSTERIENDVLPSMLKLFDDKNVVVLGTTVESMVKIANHLSAEKVDKDIWPRLMNLTDSEDVRIRCTALRTVTAILAHYRETKQPLRVSFRDKTADLLRREVRLLKQDAKEDLRTVSDEKYMVLEVQAEVFGELLYNVAKILDQSSVKEVYKAYAIMASCNGPLLRRNVAYNFPGFVLSVANKYGDLTSILELLCKDKDDEVRWNMSAGIHESLRLLFESGRADADVLSGCVLTLLTDENPAVTSNIMEHFVDIVELFRKTGHVEEIKKLVKGLNQLKGMVDGSWRLQEMIAMQLRRCMSSLGEDTICEVILPLMWRLTQQGMPPVRMTAAQSIMHCLRNISDRNRFNNSVKEYYNQLGAPENPYRVRLSQMDAALEGMEVFSSWFFREFFVKPVFKLSEDTVSNVRVKLAMHAHKLAPRCGNMFEFQAMLAKLRNDPDVDVRQAMEDFKQRQEAENAVFVSEESLVKDQKKLADEKAFYTKRSDAAEAARQKNRYEGTDGGRSEKTRNLRRGLESSVTSLRGSMAKRTSSFTEGTEGKGGAKAEESDDESSGFIRALKRSNSFSRRRRSSSAEPPASRAHKDAEDTAESSASIHSSGANAPEDTNTNSVTATTDSNNNTGKRRSILRGMLGRR
mmetsp:Transcript_12255/g.37381  ORF Transcript_12255/g.37381 Transcript_12255/m.37381 type:complete len:820 (+) Transcript_12255:360-2819(+)